MATTYYLKKGETLWDVAQRFLGSGYRWRELVVDRYGRTVSESEARRLWVGEKITIPTATPIKPSETKPTPTPQTFTVPKVPSFTPPQKTYQEEKQTFVPPGVGVAYAADKGFYPEKSPPPKEVAISFGDIEFITPPPFLPGQKVDAKIKIKSINISTVYSYDVLVDGAKISSSSWGLSYGVSEAPFSFTLPLLISTGSHILTLKNSVTGETIASKTFDVVSELKTEKPAVPEKEATKSFEELLFKGESDPKSWEKAAEIIKSIKEKGLRVAILGTLGTELGSSLSSVYEKAAETTALALPETRAIVPYVAPTVGVISASVWSAIVDVGLTIGMVLSIIIAVINNFLTFIWNIAFIKNFSFYWNPRAVIDNIIATQLEMRGIGAHFADVLFDKIEGIRVEITKAVAAIPKVDLTPINEALAKIPLQIQATGLQTTIDVLKPTLSALAQINTQIAKVETAVSTFAAQLTNLSIALPRDVSLATTQALVPVASDITAAIDRATEEIKKKGCAPEKICIDHYKRFLENLFQSVGSLSLILGGLVALDAIKTLYPDLWDKFLKWVTETMEPFEKVISPFTGFSFKESPEKPEHLVTGLKQAVSGLLLQTLFSFFVAYLARLPYTFISAMIFRFTRYETILRYVRDPFIRQTIGRRFEYSANIFFKTNLPPWHLVERIFARRIDAGGLGHGELLDRFLDMRGIFPELRDHLKAAIRRPLDPFSFAFLSQTGYFREADWKWLVRDMGYREEVLDFLIKAPMMWGLSPFKTSIRTRLMQATADGFLDLGTATSVIQNLWPILDLKAVAEIEAKTRYWYETTKDKVDQLIDKYVKGLINENELRESLTSGSTIHLHAEEPGVATLDVDLPFYVVNKERVEFYVEQAKVRKARKPREELLPDQKRYISSALISGYREGVLTENNLKEFLKEVEQIDNIESLILFRAKIVKLIEDEIEKRREEEREKWGAISAVSSVIIRRFAEGFIDEKTRDELLDKAISIKDKKEAFIFKSEQEKLLEEELEKRRTRERDLVDELKVLASVITNFYKEGFWTKEKMESEIDSSKKIVDIKEALKKRAELEREFEELMEKKRESRRKAREYISVVAGILTNMFKEGYISRETLESELSVAEKIYDPKGAYLMRADWEKSFEFISNSIKILTEKRLQNLISDGTLYSELEKLGVQEWKIDLIFEEISLKIYGKTLPREIKLEVYYNDLKKILDKHLKAGFIKIETLKSELERARTITDPLSMFRLKVEWEKEYDSKVVSLMLYDDQFRRDIITEGVYLEKLKTIYAYPEYIDMHLAQIKGEKVAGVK